VCDLRKRGRGGGKTRIYDVRTAASVVLVWTPSERRRCWGVVIAGKACWLHAPLQLTEAVWLHCRTRAAAHVALTVGSCQWWRVGLGGPPPSAQGSLSCSVQRGGLAACDSTPAIFSHRTTSRGPHLSPFKRLPAIYLGWSRVTDILRPHTTPPKQSRLSVL
jgi:hypothetical protein